MNFLRTNPRFFKPWMCWRTIVSFRSCNSSTIPATSTPCRRWRRIGSRLALNWNATFRQNPSDFLNFSTRTWMASLLLPTWRKTVKKTSQMTLFLTYQISQNLQAHPLSSCAPTAKPWLRKGTLNPRITGWRMLKVWKECTKPNLVLWLPWRRHLHQNLEGILSNLTRLWQLQRTAL